MAATTTTAAFDTQHQDMIHDAQLDYYGKRLATCSSDRTVRVFEVQGDKQTLVEALQGHDGPVWQVAWAHPRFGPILASCSYDGRVIIWKEIEGDWVRVKEHQSHTSSVNSIAWAPQELGPILACASSDGYVSILTFNADEGVWTQEKFLAHHVGVNAVTWSSPVAPGSLIQGNNTTAPNTVKRLATGGCDNLVKIWVSREGEWVEDTVLELHSEWVRDVAFAPNFGLTKTLLASCSQDRTVVISTHDAETNTWTKMPLRETKFPDVVWRVSWSLTGSALAVSGGDNKVTVWKQNLKGAWECVEELTEKV
ncbi:GTPase-activating protein S13 [Tieghemiomyces parasiticus]|uniref:GTPase-activating protein S13 n=1 Tax=Tieghemiomyces parasiticus TaxID=78921 RepID=A0A9W8ABC6_9FUNG|nr:GTPase-activating protein S13 [Tieghemiomyces parasiticus]